MQWNPIADYESYKLDDEYINKMASELWRNEGGDTIR
jgi:hypothetical protein